MNGLQYYYVEGRLNSIYWEDGGCLYEIEGNLSNYPATGGSTMLTQLLNRATAVQGLEAFKASINTPVTE